MNMTARVFLLLSPLFLLNCDIEKDNLLAGHWTIYGIKKRLLNRILFLLLASFHFTGISGQKNNALPYYDNDKWGLAERGTVKIILNPIYETMTPLGEGYFRVEDTTSDIIFIDSTGKEVLHLPDDIILKTNDGLFRYNNMGDHVWYHKSGRKLEIDNTEVNSTGKCYEKRLMYYGTNGKQGFLDEYGKVAVKAEYDLVYAFDKGYGTVINKEKWGMVDFGGKLVIPIIYEGVKSLGEGYFAIYKNKLLALADKNNKLITAYIFDFINRFSEGLTWVSKGKQRWYINSKGINPFKKTFTKVSSFENGIAIVNDGNNDLLINNKGVVQYKVPAHLIVKGAMDGWFFEIENKTTGKFSIINPSGKVLFEGMDELPHAGENGLTMVVKDKKYGVINASGEIVLPLNFTQLIYVKEVSAWLAYDDAGENFFYIDEKGNVYKKQ